MSDDFNALLAGIVATTPMGRLLRRFWIPFARSASIATEGAPRRVGLLGEKLVAFRLRDGRLSLIDEACPHRCASLALARNEGDGLRCIFHGWKLDAEGCVREAPNELPERQALITERVKPARYRVREAGGLAWALLDERAETPFPEFEFTRFPAEHVHIRSGIVQCHWLQALESVLDAAHIGFLHRDTVLRAMSAAARNNAQLWIQQASPRLDIEPTTYGFREAALRPQADGRINTKIREVVLPWHAMLPGEPGCERQIVTTVPIDATRSLQFVILFNPFAPLTPAVIDAFWADASADHDDFGKGLPGVETMWGQDRAAMSAGHFSGLANRHVFCEDFAILESMGALTDRAREHLTQSDLSIIQNRQLLVRLARALEAGELPACLRSDGAFDIARLRTTSVNLPSEVAWRSWDVFQPEPTRV